MKFWISEDDCTGCGACANACTENAISMRANNVSGFLYPHIDESKCIDCYCCQESCPITQGLNGFIDRMYKDKAIQHAYAARSIDEQLRYDSTSGGLFTELANQIIAMGGLVYGAGFNQQMDVVHFGIECVEDLAKLRKSKYVQSSIGHTFREIQTHLKRGRVTLFVGAPCQVAGLYKFLGEDFNHLYTAEFICLGVNSPLAYRKWIEELERCHESKVSFIWFKYKCDGWRQSPFCTRIEFQNGMNLVLNSSNNYYMQGFLQGNFFLRHSCSNCRFMGNKRVADLVLGDYWSVDNRADDNKGTSVVLINSDKGNYLFNQVRSRISFYNTTIESICETNPRFITPSAHNPLSDSFFRDLQNQEFSAVVKKYISSSNQMPDILKKIEAP